MEQEQYSVYRTPFRLKKKQQTKNSPTQIDQTKYQSAAALQIHLYQSPYSTKYASQYRSHLKSSTPIQQEQTFKHQQQVKPQRMKSAPLKKAYYFEPAEQQEDLFSSHFQHQIKAKIKTQRENPKKEIKKKFNLQKDFFSLGRYRSQRKFTISTVEIQKKKQTNNNLIKKKLQSYDYKTVLNKAIVTGRKKLSRLVINEDGVVRLERS